jgi:sugar-specific transcriptional regulator TrmB
VELQNKPLAQALTRFGLTEYESNVYLSLMRYGTCGIKDITAKSRVPRTKVYPVLKSLEKQKLVSILPGKPIKAKGLAPTSSLTEPIKNMEQDIKVMKRAIVELRKIHESASATDQLEKKEYWVTRNLEESVKRINDAISSASEEIVLSLNHEGLDIISKNSYDALILAAKNDIEVRILIRATKQDLPILNRFSDLISVKYVPFSPENNLLLVDGKELCVFKKLALIAARTTTIASEYYSGSDVCDFLKATVEGLDRSTAKDFGLMMPLVSTSSLSDESLLNPKVNQVSPVFYFFLMDSLYSKYGKKMDSTLVELGRKTLESLKKTLMRFLPPSLTDALNLVSSLYLLYEGVEARFALDEHINIVTVELTGELTPYYKTAADRGFSIPPSVWGFVFLGLLDVFGFDASTMESTYNSNENMWLLQYKLTRNPSKAEKVEGTESELVTKLT